MRKLFFSSLIIFSLIVSIIGIFSWANATVIDGGGNTLTGANSNTVNLSNSGIYGVSFSLSGTLDAGNTLVVIAMDGSGKTTT